MQMRRTERQVTDIGELSGILDRCEVGHLGVTDSEGPYVVPLSFAHVVRDGRITVYAHGADAGRKVAAIENGSLVCFEAEVRGATIPGESVHDISVAYESVVGSGTGRVVTDPGEAREAMRLLVEKYASGRGDELPPVLHGVTVLAFDLDDVDGKRNPS